MHNSSDGESSDEKSFNVENDTSIDSKILLCATHLGKLLNVVEKMGERAPLQGILEGKLDDASDNKSLSSSH